jgi:hypothetical protein
MKPSFAWTGFIVSVFAMAGCSHQAPTVSHVHIGHAMAGWYDTPNKQGLFTVAEEKAADALKSAQVAVGNTGDLEGIKANIYRTRVFTEAETAPKGEGVKYGVKEALSGAVDHIGFSADAADATANVKSFAKGFGPDAAGVLNRCDLIVALSGDVSTSTSAQQAELLAQQIEKLARANINGEDLDGDGVIGSRPDEYGLVQLRRDIDAMIAREDPPYTTVDSWYLFNLIRLPNGNWKLPKPPIDPQVAGNGGSGGGSGGGY